MKKDSAWFNDATEVFEQYESFADVPEAELERLGVRPSDYEWLEENFPAIKAGFEGIEDFIDDNLRLLGIRQDREDGEGYEDDYEIMDRDNYICENV